MTWDSPWGRGYPGWHIECSAMSMKYLGKHFDIHTGGIDHIPVHHTNEIAQSEGSFDDSERAKGPWVNYWMHNEFLILEGGKMSKSSGNFITLQTTLPPEKGFSLKDKGYEPLDYRYFLLTGHYRKPLTFSVNGMDSAKASRQALNERIAKLISRANDEEKLGLTLENFSKVLENINYETDNYAKFKAGLENDLATPVALAAMQKESNEKGGVKLSEALSAIYKMDKVLSLDVIKNGFAVLENQKKQNESQVDLHSDDPEAAEINALVAERTTAKKEKNFARADEIRNLLSARGVVIIDTPNGPTWKRQ